MKDVFVGRFHLPWAPVRRKRKMSIRDIMMEKSHAVQILGVSFSTTSTLTSSAGVNARMSQGRFTDEESIAPVATGLKRLREEVLPVASSCAVIETAQRSVGILLVLVCVMGSAGATSTHRNLQ
jgi:hypothetical protein